MIMLFCPICSAAIRYEQNKPLSTYHHKEFGIICGEKCYKEAGLKYARLVLRKDDPTAVDGFNGFKECSDPENYRITRASNVIVVDK